MTRRRLSTVLAAGVLAVASTLLPGPSAGADSTTTRPGPVVRSVGPIAGQDVAPQPGSEPDTLVEPDVAVSPVNPRIAVAAAHDGRFPDGGAVDISYSWTHDGGRSWHHAPMPDLTKAVGGAWDRVSDPVVAFGPDGTVYISTLRPGLDHVNVDVAAEDGRVYVSYGTRDTGVQGGRFVRQRVSVSADGGRHFRPPLTLGPPSDLNYAAEAGGKFPGDYIGSAVRAGRVYLVWARSSAPPDPAARFHQTLWAAVLAG